jgi:hypothetical protein
MTLGQILFSNTLIFPDSCCSPVLHTHLSSGTNVGLILENLSHTTLQQWTNRDNLTITLSYYNLHFVNKVLCTLCLTFPIQQLHCSLNEMQVKSIHFCPQFISVCYALESKFPIILYIFWGML